MLTIRLVRIGKKRQPSYRFVISEKARDPQAPALEILGTYNPRTEPAAITVNAERIQYWIGKGAQLSSTVHNLLVDQKVIDRKKVVTGKAKAKPVVEGDAKPEAPAAAPKEAVEAAKETTPEPTPAKAEEAAA